MEPKPRVLISGAGIAGLTCALWLVREGFEPVVVERANSVRGGGFLVSLSHHAYRSAASLGIMGQVEARGCGITSSGYYDAAGRCLLELDYAALFGGVELVQIMRDELVDILYRAAKDSVDIRFGDQIQTIDQAAEGVAVSLQSGVSEKWDLVVGADGVNSRVREIAFPADQVTEHPLGLMCAAYRLPNVIGLRNRFETHMRRDRYMATFSSGGADIGAVFIWDNPDQNVPESEQRRHVLQQAFATADASTMDVVGNCPSEGGIYMDSLKQIELPDWRQGHVVLVGDAAHALTPFSGRGAAAAVNGATRLAKAIIELPLEQAIACYQARMRPIIDGIQPATRRAVRWYVPRSRPRHFVRNAAMQLLPNALFRRYFQFKYSNI